MPFYDFVCKSCSHKFEKLTSYNDKVVCTKCGSDTERKFGKFHGHGLPNGFSSTRSKSRKGE